MKINNIFCVFLIALICSCSSKPKELQLWKITSENNITSYLSPSTNTLSKHEVNELLSDKTIQAFDSSDVYISFWDLANNNFIEINKLVALDSGKTLKDTLNESLITTIQSQIPFDYPNKIENSPLKLQFYLHDYLYSTTATKFNLDLFWFRQAMPAQKEIKGLISYQDFYSLYSGITIPSCENFIKKNNIKDYGLAIEKENRELVSSGNIDQVKRVKSSYDIFYSANTNAKAGLYKKWYSSIQETLNSQTSFISLDASFLTNEESFIDFLLSNGYQIEEI